MSKRSKHTWRLSLLAGITAATMLLAGCGQGDSASTGSTDASGAASGSESGTGEVTSVRWITAGTPQTGMDQVLEEVNKLLAERYGLELQLEIYDYGSYDEKMNMLISSGEEFDVCFTTQSWLNKYQPNVSRGAFLALDDLIDEHAPDLKEVLPEFLFEQARVDGSIYAIPNYQICYDSFGFMMRKDLVEKYNFDWENVKTEEDMYPFWDAIRDNEPGLYPVGDLSIQAFEDDYVAMRMIQDYYTVAGSGASSFYIKKGDDSYTVDWYPDVVKEYRREFGELYEKGYIRDDIITLQDDSADITAGKYASRLGIIKPGGEAEQKQLAGGYDYVQIALTEPFVNSLSARAAMNAVSSSSKNPEAAIRMIDVMNTDKEIFNMLNFGIEGTNYTMEDGFVKEIPDSGYFFNSGWALGNQFNAYLVEGQQEGVWEETMEINNNAEVSPISGFSFNEDPVATAMAQMSSVTSEYKFIGLYDDFDTRFEEFRTKMEQAGVEEYKEEVQNQLNEWLEANGKI